MMPRIPEANEDMPHPAANPAHGAGASLRVRAVPPAAASLRVRRHRIWRDFWLGVIAGALLIAVKVRAEHSWVVEHVEHLVYDLVQVELAESGPESVPLVVLDISEMKPQVIPGAKQSREAAASQGRVPEQIPRQELKPLLEAVAKQGPLAIGVDGDFSLYEESFDSPEDPEFFKFCLGLQDKNGKHVPVHLGVFRAQRREPEWWLGKNYTALAASILVPNDRSARDIISELRAGRSDAPALRSMSALLAAPITVPPKGLPWLVSLFFSPISFRTTTDNLYVGTFPVDYSARKLLEDSRVQTISAEEISTRFARRFAGMVVLIGRASPGQATDVVGYSPDNAPILGIYTHACAALTLARAPLFEVRGWKSVLIDILLTALVLLVVVGIRLAFLRPAGPEVAHRRVEGLLIFLIVLGCLAAGFWMVSWTRVLWADFLLVIFALALHPAAERRLDAVLEPLSRVVPEALRKFIFLEEEEARP